MRYFAYGSNINLDHLHDCLAAHETPVETELVGEAAVLHDYKLRTNYLSATHVAGACNIEPARGDRVEGILLTITPAIRDVLRVKEGFPIRNEEAKILVQTASAATPVKAFTYIVTPAHRFEVDMPVTRRYRRLILAGAKQVALSKAYQKHLRSKLWTARIRPRPGKKSTSPSLR